MAEGDGEATAPLDDDSLTNHYEELKNFVRSWGIDGPNTVDLMLCSVELQQDAMGKFMPSADTRNVNAVFRRFVQRLSSGEPDGSDPLRSFAYQWGLDDGAIKILYELSPEEQSDVMSSFSPGDDIRNKSAFFMKFVRSRQNQEQVSAGGDAEPSDPLASFVSQWGLDENAANVLYELPLEMQDDIMSAFNPRGADIRNVSAMFTKFVKSRQNPENHTPARDTRNRADHHKSDYRSDYKSDHKSDPYKSIGPIETFVEKWGLDETATECLLQLSSTAQADVMAAFSPRADVRNVSALFLSFAKTRSSKGSNDSVSVFVSDFGLDYRSEKLLRDMNWELQEDIIANFKPPPDTNNINGLFTKFAGGRKLRRPSDPVDDFVRKWDLDAAAREALVGLPEHIQQDIMATFFPSANTRNYSAVFQSFVKRKRSSQDWHNTESSDPPWKRART